ncbi:hypothetical protein [Lapidilactobacillus wuchangensis]|uniref:hypothetical protein n=1 Tax=Lapidilactobacillus wuchangensis TaxID=2486001 RepID=UPI000F779041|nr:hypothetical protein [Lapidilactobacillus wuchangensis]
MRQLFKYQFWQLLTALKWQILLWLLISWLIIFGSAWQIRLNPHVNLCQVLFLGTSAADLAARRISLPINWLVILIMPIILFGDGLPWLNQRSNRLLHGLGYQRWQFTLTNCWLMMSYSLFTSGQLSLVMLLSTVLLKQPIIGQEWYLLPIIFGANLSLLFLDNILVMFNRYAGMIIEIFILVLTVFVIIPGNFLNLTMLSRLEDANQWQVWPSLICWLLVLVTGYFVIDLQQFSWEGLG